MDREARTSARLGRKYINLVDRVSVLEHVVMTAESWFEAITEGRYQDIPKKQAILLEVIESYRARNKP